MRFIKNWAKATFILTLLVIIAGGIVRTTQSGMGCPDWPKCFGLWIPPTNASELPANFESYLKAQDIDHTFNAFHTWIEYINRLLGVLLGVFGIIQFVINFRKRSENARAYKLAIAFLAVVILTGLVGAVVVKLNLAHVSISVHLFLALVITQIQLAMMMATSGKLYKKTAGIKMRRVFVYLLIIFFIQAVLGTMVRMYVDDVSKSLHFVQRESWLAELPIAFLIHRSFSWVVLAAVGYSFWYTRKIPALKNSMRNIFLLALCSMTSGIVLYYLDMPAIAQPLHLLLATLLITQTMFALLYTKNTTDLAKRQVL
jgi:heme a synthase